MSVPGKAPCSHQDAKSSGALDFEERTACPAMKLNLLISTIDGRVGNVPNMLLPYRVDVSYIVSHQVTAERYRPIPAQLRRPDVLVSQISGKGVTKSRNNGIRLADGDIALFSDDDVTYTNEFLDRVIHRFTGANSLDIAVFKIKTPDGSPDYKEYPNKPIHITRKLPFAVGTIEIAVRVERIRAMELLFDERFGAGQPVFMGADESIFVLDAVRSGLSVWFYPEYVVEHPYESTFKTMGRFDGRVTSLTGAYDARINGFIAIPRAFLATVKLVPEFIRHRQNPLRYLKDRLSATLYILKSNRNLRSSRSG